MIIILSCLELWNLFLKNWNIVVVWCLVVVVVVGNLWLLVAEIRILFAEKHWSICYARLGVFVVKLIKYK